MSVHGEVLIAILNNLQDFNIAYEHGWYRIPVGSANKWLKDSWPPRWLAFYQTKKFGQQAYAINYCAQIAGIRKVYRWEMFPDQPHDAKSEERYYQLFFDQLNPMKIPIVSRRRRRIIFIPTTQEKFAAASEINDLYDESPLEDLLWLQLKHWAIYAERQELVSVKDQNYFLDFAIYCAQGKVDVETDGDTWHANPEKADLDNQRDNAIEVAGWKLLRYNTRRIHEQMTEYCIPEIVKTINSLGGLEEGAVPRKIDLNAPKNFRQLGLFDM